MNVPPTPETSVAIRCLNCDRLFAGRFCPACGQRADTQRLSARSMLGPVLELVNWERGLMHTAAALLRRPGRTIQDYLAGKRAEYVGPIKFVAVIVSVALLALWFAGMPAHTGPGAAREQEAEISRIIDQYGTVLLLATVPLTALCTRVCFRRRRLNFAEHLALNAYVFGVQNILSIPLIPLQHLGPLWPAGVTAVYTLVILTYFAVVLKGVLARSWWTAALASVLITAVAWVVFFLSVGVIIKATHG